ncbi:MAG: tetratricopeptide repeat protein [Verrucomicrobiota bacterium]
MAKQGRWLEAAAAYRAALESDPNDVSTLLNLASVLSRLGNTEAAVSMFEHALRLDSNSVEALNNLAWIFATDSKDGMRDGTRAVAYGERACELTRYQLPAIVGTLAAAYAEAGRFSEAIVTAERAISLARAIGQAELAARNSELLELYRAQKPWHEPAPAGGIP